MPKVMSAQELAEYLGLHYRTVLRLAQQGKIPGRMVGGVWRFHEEVINRWLTGEYEPPNTNQQVEAVRRGGGMSDRHRS